MKKQKVYVVLVRYCDQDTNNDVFVAGVFNTLEKAKKCYLNHINDYAPEKNEDGGVERLDDFTCEIINYDADYNATVKIAMEEIK